MKTRLLATTLAATLAISLGAGVAGPAMARSLLTLDAANAEGQILITLPRADEDGIAARYLYVAQIETGVGSAATGVDRGAPLRNGILRFRRIGKKVVAELENTAFIAPAGSPEQRESVANSFTNATLWVGDIKSTAADGAFTFDFAPFLAMDHFGFAEQLGEGYALQRDYSLADPAQARAFPDNAEFSALLSFTSKKPSPGLANVSPTGRDVSLWVRHSLVALPTDPIAPRTDPYGFAFSETKYDFSAPLGRSMLTKLAARHRLEKTDPAAARSPVKEPIVYYVDPAAPEPVRQALIDGVSWWAEAFDAAGFVDAFRVDVLPEGVDPLDIRYNVVNWVNRATRGWSYGPSITDPRTGEILKGSVMLGSLRVRQDILIFQALLGAGLTDTGDPNDPIPAALARIRQLGAHEVGHTLGLAHNFAASSQGRYSVMDYPAPRIRLIDGKLDLTDAYGTGVGEWDKFAIRYLYAARTDEEARAMVAEAQARGLRFVSNADTDGTGAADPFGGLWDDGMDPVAELRRIMAVRKAALARFDVDAIPAGQDMASLRRAFVPIWLLHRYQVEASAKALGGVYTPTALAGDDAAVVAVEPAVQAAAFEALMEALSTEALSVPERLQAPLSFGPRTDYDYATTIEIMPLAGGSVFDRQRAAEIGAIAVLDNLLDPQRLNRLSAQANSSSAAPDAHQVVNRLLNRADQAASEGEIGRRIATTIVLSIAKAARAGALSKTLAFQIDGQLQNFATRLAQVRGDRAEMDWRRGLSATLTDREALARMLADPNLLPSLPPGSPI